MFYKTDYAGWKETRQSTSGHLIRLYGATISWNSKNQKCVALSTAEAEFIATCDAIKSAKFIQQLVQEFTKNLPEIHLSLDNQAAIAYIKNGGYSAKLKHVDTRYKDLLATLKETNVAYIKTKQNPADFASSRRRLFPVCRHDQGAIWVWADHRSNKYVIMQWGV